MSAKLHRDPHEQAEQKSAITATYLNRVVNNQIDGDVGVDLSGISSKTLGSITHGSKIDDGRDTSEILKDDTSRLESDLSVSLGGVG